MSDQKQKDEMTERDRVIKAIETFKKSFTTGGPTQIEYEDKLYAQGFLNGERSVYSSPEIRNLIEAAKFARNNIEHVYKIDWEIDSKLEEALTAIDRKRGEML